MSDLPAAALVDAIATGHVATVEALLAVEPALAAADVVWDGRSVPALIYLINAPFHGLCPRGEQDAIAARLIDHGADADWDAATDPRGETPLMTAVSLYEIGIVDLLLERGVDLERRGGAIDGGTALDLGIVFAATREVDRLVGAGARTGTIDRAAGAGRVDELRRHLADGASITSRTVLSATVNGRLGCLDALVEAGTDLHGVFDDATLLHWATWHGRDDVVAHLLEFGLDPRTLDRNHGLTPRQWALYRRDEKKWPFPDGLTAVAGRLEAAGG